MLCCSVVPTIGIRASAPHLAHKRFLYKPLAEPPCCPAVPMHHGSASPSPSQLGDSGGQEECTRVQDALHHQTWPPVPRALSWHFHQCHIYVKQIQRRNPLSSPPGFARASLSPLGQRSRLGKVCHPSQPGFVTPKQLWVPQLTWRSKQRFPTASKDQHRACKGLSGAHLSSKDLFHYLLETTLVMVFPMNVLDP